MRHPHPADAVGDRLRPLVVGDGVPEQHDLAREERHVQQPDDQSGKHGQGQPRPEVAREAHGAKGRLAPAVRVEPVVAPPPGNPRFPLFDGLRAIAVLAVLVTHTALLSGANELAWYGKYTARLDVGVTVFSLISGFLLSRPFVAAHLDDRAAPRVRHYTRPLV